MTEKATLARPYAKALFSLAEQRNMHQPWQELLDVWSSVVFQVRELLKNKSVTVAAASKLIVDALEPTDPLLKNFLLVLQHQKRLMVLPEIVNLYTEMRLQAQNAMQVDLYSPVEVTAAQQKKYQKMLEQRFSKTAEMTYHLDEKLLGGFVARVGCDVVDGSVPGFLKNLKLAMGG